MEIYRNAEGDYLLVRWQSRSWVDDKPRPYVVNGGYYLSGERFSETLVNPLGDTLTFVSPAPAGKDYNEILNNVTGQLL